MKPERWSEMMELFHAAYDRDPAERPAFLAAACPDDAELRQEVAALLAADENASAFLALEHGAELRAAAMTHRPQEHSLVDRLQAALGSAYRVERELGGGGMSRVFVAEETRLGRRVAVKVLPPELGAALNAERFHREARLIASLRHPHIVPLLAAGEGPGGLLYYTMPYVESESLGKRLSRDRRLALAEVVDIVREVAGALAYAHERGVIHRDIKPANILMEGAHALVADFGIAKAALGQQGDASDVVITNGTSPTLSSGTLTAAGFVLGTPAYMSPEQAAGQRVDARTDVYSLGCLTFELLTGKRPFADAEAASLERRTVEPPPSASALVSGLPSTLDTVLTRAFAPRADDRYQGAKEFADALAGAAAPRTDGTRLRWTKRRIAIAALAIVAVGTGAADLTQRIATAGTRTRSGGIATRDHRTIAVLPFANVGLARDAYLADGVTDELTTRLTNLQGLRVISQRSTREYRSTSKSPMQIGRELGADYLLQGRVRWEASNDSSRQVRVTAELVSAHDGAAVWADRYGTGATDVIDVESQIAERVATALQLVLGNEARQTLAARPTMDFEAYSDFLRGEALRTGPGGAGGALQQAIVEYERAIARDPRFALAYARLSEVHSRLYHAEVDRSPRRAERARVAAETAVRLAPALAEGHLALGYYHYYTRRDYARAEEELARALTLQPGRAEILLARGYVLRRQARFAEAAANLARAVELEPRSAQAAYDVAETYSYSRAFREAMPYYDRAIALSPEFVNAYAEKARRLVAWNGDTTAARRIVHEGLMRGDPGQLIARLNYHALLLLGNGAREYDAIRALTVASFGHDTTQFYLWTADWARLHGDSLRRHAYADSARQRLEPIVAAEPEPARHRLVLARAYAELGRRSDALREAQQSMAGAPLTTDAVDGPNFMQDLAYVEAIAGAYDAAASRLEYLLSIPSDHTAMMLRIDPRWNSLRDNPRFQRLVGTTR